MKRLIIAPDQEDANTGGGPEDPPGRPGKTFFAQGTLGLALGFALGVTLMLYHLLTKIMGGDAAGFRLQAIPLPGEFSLAWEFVGQFLLGFISGVVLSSVYNILVGHRLNIFGLEYLND